MADLKPQNPQMTVGDAVHQAPTLSVRGTIDSGAVARTAITASFVGAEVIDMEDVDRLFVILDYVKSAGDDLRIRFMWGVDDDAEAKLDIQELREDNSVANEVGYEAVEHVFTATGRFIVDVPRLLSFLKIQVKSGGTPDANDKVAIGIVGQARGGA